MTQLVFASCQRWRAGRDSYRPAGEPIDARRYGVEVVREADARGRPETLLLDAHGRVVSRRALSKIRNGEVGRDYAYRQLLAAGAPERGAGEAAEDYLRRALACGAFRRLRHPGNHAYAWRLDGQRLPSLLPYPKQVQPWA